MMQLLRTSSRLLPLMTVATAIHVNHPKVNVPSSVLSDDAKVISAHDATTWLTKSISPAHGESPGSEYLQKNTALALKARAKIPAAALVPKELFLREVLPYRLVDEPIDGWRETFYEKLAPHAMKAKTLKDVVEEVVPRAFTDMGREVVFKPDCTPKIMAPLSETLENGYASCTGCSIFLVDALRSVGVPARVVGIAEWNLPTKGNHNWVEAWTGEGEGDGWHFFDAAPVTKVEWDRAWFVPSQVNTAISGGMHGIYAPVWDTADANANYTITWREPYTQIPAVDRTAFYKGLTSKCPECPYTGLPGGKPTA